jgi:CheY-like chemotaxis protein
MNGSQVTILLVEDDPAHAEIIRRNFAHFRVLNRLNHVSDGQEALDYLYNRPPYQDQLEYPAPDLVLLDLRLPKIDGIEVLKTLKTDPQKKHLPVVVLTTSSAEKDILSAYRYNANSYLVKPVDFAQFTDLMKTLGYYWLIWNKFPS